MRLTIKNISAFLMEKGLLKAKSIVDGDFIVTQSQNRNAIFRIHLRDGQSLFVKQLVSFDSQNSYLLQKDATCLWLIKNESVFKELSQYVPAYYGYDPEKQVLIVEYIPDAKDIETVYQAERFLKPELLDQVAKILSAYHFKLEYKTLTNRSVQFFMRQLPWTFQMAANPKSYGNQTANMYGPNPIINYLLNNQAFLDVMKKCVEEYEYSTLVHGDIKWVNFIMKDATDVSTIKIIDWELADIGDPLWDVAGVIQSLFASKVIMLSAAAANPYQVMPQLTEAQMTQTFQEIKQLWEAYAKYQGFKEEQKLKGLKKVIRFAGMRLVQTAFEHNMNQQQMSPNATVILQLSYSLMSQYELFFEQINKLNAIAYENAN